MCNILIFGGTTEGRELAEFCTKNGISAYVSVATEYGAKLLEKSCLLHILTGRLTAVQMTEFIFKNQIKLVIDATHPYAVEATENICLACKNASVRCMRVLRETGEICGYGKYFSDTDSLIDYLKHTNERILITTGSKELGLFCRLNNFRERCAVRVLPSQNITDECISLGFDKEKIIAQKGPFSVDKNIEHLRKYNARYMVTKDSGSTGGFPEKAKAAQFYGAELLIIKRPQESGITLKEAEKILESEWRLL